MIRRSTLAGWLRSQFESSKRTLLKQYFCFTPKRVKSIVLFIAKRTFNMFSVFKTCCFKLMIQFEIRNVEIVRAASEARTTSVAIPLAFEICLRQFVKAKAKISPALARKAALNIPMSFMLHENELKEIKIRNSLYFCFNMRCFFK